ncbi:hypothetical protein D915_010836 [Fasciola hepatica]|uniref:C-type lectin domain-containing protein n=1 Tax=Fasciola hepatica TaxID=6192 RepID=A0A4E0QTV7_FASHE|nr:hypothetical protein D915_010836 [Fasciola hepatica]
MSARIFAVPIIILLIWTQPQHSACPTNLVEVAPDICMLVIRSKGSFCEAHELCETEGQTRGMQLFVPGRNAQLIPAIVPPESIVFTGISAFLNRSLNNREGWRSQWSFYEAHELCETEGQTSGMHLFVPGRNAQLIPAVVPPDSIVFTGISAFLNRSLNNREGWRYADPGSSSNGIDASDRSIPWSHGEPNDIYGSIAPFYSLNLRDGLQLSHQSTHVACQMSNDQINAPMEMFKRN